MKKFLLLTGKYMELFFRLIILPLIVVALILHACPKWKCQWKIEMFYFSLKKLINTRGGMNSKSLSLRIVEKEFFCFVLIFVLLPRKCYSPNFGQLCLYLVFGRPHFFLSFYVLLLIVLWYLPSGKQKNKNRSIVGYWLWKLLYSSHLNSIGIES